MKLSIITVCFNAENTIEKTIKSILEQTSTEFEWVVVDGKSTDTTNEIIKKYLPEFEYKGVKVNYCSENDKGIYDAMNKGAQRARIKLKLKAYDRCQSIDPTTEIRKSHRQIHLFKSGSICIIQHG